MEKSKDNVEHKKDAVYSNGGKLESFANFSSSITNNNLTKFKKYLDNKNSDINKYVGENGVVYSYKTKFDAYGFDKDNKLVNFDGTGLNDEFMSSFGFTTTGDTSGMSNFSSAMINKVNTNNMSQLLVGNGTDAVAPAIKDNYDLVYGNYPQNYDEVIIVLDKNNELSIVELYTMGFLPSAEYKELLKKITSSEKVDIETAKLSYEDICKHPIYILPASDSYVKNENGLYEKVTSQEELPALVNEKGLKLKITGIIRPKEDNDSQLILSY